MKENKNIERLFQEKFKEFEVSPPDIVWENIQEKLQSDKKKRRLLPLWLNVGSIAASFAVLFTLLFLLLKEEPYLNFKPNINNRKYPSTITKSNQEIKSETNEITNISNKQNRIEITASSRLRINQNDAPHESNLTRKNNQKRTKTSFDLNEYNTNYVTTYSDHSSFETLTKEKKPAVKELHHNQKNKNYISKSRKATFIASEKEVILATNEKSELKNTNLDEPNQISLLSDSNLSTAKIKIDSFGIATLSKSDSLPLVQVKKEENPLEKLLKEKEEKMADEKEKLSKWAINSFVAPVYFNSFAQGSPISEEFINNTKKFNNSMSFGIGIAYQLTTKLSIKTGINSLSLDYDTQDIAYYTSYKDQSNTRINIERNQNSKYLVLENQKKISVNLIENQVLASGQNEGYLNQKMQYIEVPVELSYSLVNKKIGVALKGGFSTLLLTENKVSIISETQQMEIGKATNLNNMHFSSNIGLGFSYNFKRRFQANLEPMLKYQINAYNSNTGNFKPYIIGISTGLTYKF